MRMLAARPLLALLGVVACVPGQARADEPPPAPAPAPVRAPVGYVGIELAPAFFFDAEERARLRLERSSGIVVNHLVRGAPANRAGVRFGDVLLRFAGHDVPSSEPPADPADFGATMEGYERWLRSFRALGIVVKPGAEVELTVRREDKPTTLKMVAIDEKALVALLDAAALERYPDVTPAPVEPPRARGFAGLTLDAVGLLTPGWRLLLGKVPDEGVVATRVAAGSPAAAAGLERGDLVKRYGGKAAPSTQGMDAAHPDGKTRWQEAFKALTGGRFAGDVLEVEVERAGAPLTLKMKLVDRTTLDRATYRAGEGNRF